MELNLEFVRKQFPALGGDWTYFDNAGGSQTLKSVTERISEYLLTSDVQLGASYEVSQIAGNRIQEGFQFVADIINAREVSEVIFGSSTTMLLRQLSHSLVQTMSPGDEIIVTNCDHEANIGPWVNLEKQGIIIKFWEINQDSFELDPEDLKKLLSPKTKFVSLTYASNILGTINPVKEIIKLAHKNGSYVCLDAVAYAPHRLPDVQVLDVDFYAFSFYKVYGPHYSALYGKKEILKTLPNINHFFIAEDDIPYKLQPGSSNYELSYGYLGCKDYIEALVNFHFPEKDYLDIRSKAKLAFQLFADHEEKLTARFLNFLNKKENVKIIGKTTSDKNERVATISFIIDGVVSSTITEKVDKYKIGIRFGDFYARRLIVNLGLFDQNGVIRVSMVHYNTMEEVDRLIEILDPLI
ncbi:MAG: cysteine desulfurase-like protein [Bacteroidetes bacterium]|nr:cysteine desulfurase-like protein [Bacteroidota bacterium]